MSKVNVARALSARIARRFIRIASFVVVGVFILVFVITALLAYFFSAWWWLLIIPFVVVLVVLAVLRIVLLLIVRGIYNQRLSADQTTALDAFVDKVQALLEARATPWPLIVLICLKDLLINRDVVTVRSIIRDSVNLTRDYKELERLLG